jgi:ribosomal protein S18 acetylase RimI-like enzyme
VAIEQRQGLVSKQRLSEEEIAAIRALALRCEQAEQLHMRIDWTMLQHRTGDQTNDFLYYSNDRLVGYLAVDDRGGAENEITGMVDPEQRRRGIFSLLLDAAFEECRKRGVLYMILICEHSSLSGQAFLRARDATYSEAEHEMLLTESKVYTGGDDRVLVRPARHDEVDKLVQVQVESFEQGEERSRQHLLKHIQEHMQEPDLSTYYIGVFGEPEVGCEEAIGSCRADMLEGIVGIYAFGVRPEYQGRGYGRQILQTVIQDLHEKGYPRIMLDVNVENARALHLYRSSGFTIRTTYDYYIIAA